jgi:hypothetical protein
MIKLREKKQGGEEREEEGKDVQVEYSKYCLTCPCSLPSA